MDKHENDIVSCALLGLGIVALFCSYLLPVFGGVIFQDKVLHGWEVTLFTFAGALNFWDGRFEAILAGMLLCNLILTGGFVVFFFKGSALRWYKPVLAGALLYVLSVSVFILKPGTFKAGYYAYISSYILVGAALFMKAKQPSGQ